MYNILICDDEVDIVNALKIYLQDANYVLYEAFNGKEALEAVKNKDIHLILMDIMMPEMNGYETTKAIRNLPDRPDGKKIPIIAMTANAFAEDVQAALNAGMDDHVAKPVDMSILISVITKYIEKVQKQKFS